MEQKIEISAFPFKGIKIASIVNATSNYEILVTNHGHSYDILSNGDIIDVEGTEKGIMAFLKFIADEIEKYRVSSLCTMDELLSTKEREVSEFISLIVDRMDLTIEAICTNMERPTPADIRGCLGQKFKFGDVYLYDIIELLMNAKGYKHVEGTFDQIVKIEDPIDTLPEEIAIIIEKLEEHNVSLGTK